MVPVIDILNIIKDFAWDSSDWKFGLFLLLIGLVPIYIGDRVWHGGELAAPLIPWMILLTPYIRIDVLLQWSIFSGSGEGDARARLRAIPRPRSTSDVGPHRARRFEWVLEDTSPLLTALVKPLCAPTDTEEATSPPAARSAAHGSTGRVNLVAFRFLVGPTRQG